MTDPQREVAALGTATAGTVPVALVGALAGVATTGSASLYLLGKVALNAYSRQAGIPLNSTTTLEVIEAAIPLACFIGAYAVILGMNIWDYRTEASRETERTGPGRTGAETVFVHVRILTTLFGQYVFTLLAAAICFGFDDALFEDPSVLPALAVACLSHVVYLEVCKTRGVITLSRRLAYIVVFGTGMGWVAVKMTAIGDLFYLATALVGMLILATLMAQERFEESAALGRRALSQLAMLGIMTLASLGWVYGGLGLFAPLGGLERTGPQCLSAAADSALPDEVMGARAMLATESALYVQGANGRNFRVPVDNLVYAFEPCP